MGNKYQLIRIYREDFDKFKTEAREELIRNSPDLKGLKISDSYLFMRMLKWWLK